MVKDTKVIETGQTIVNNLDTLIDTKANTTDVVLRDGTQAMTGNLDIGNFNIVNLADPVNDQDGATKAYVDSRGAPFASLQLGSGFIPSNTDLTDPDKFISLDNNEQINILKNTQTPNIGTITNFVSNSYRFSASGGATETGTTGFQLNPTTGILKFPLIPEYPEYTIDIQFTYTIDIPAQNGRTLFLILGYTDYDESLTLADSANYDKFVRRSRNYDTSGELTYVKETTLYNTRVFNASDRFITEGIKLMFGHASGATNTLNLLEMLIQIDLSFRGNIITSTTFPF